MPSSKGFTVIEIVVAIVVLAIVGGGVYMYASRNTTTKSADGMTASEMSKMSPTPTSVLLPAGWSYKQSAACAVEMPVPPTSLSTWKFLDEMTLEPANNPMAIFDKRTSMLNGTGEVESWVSVDCAENTKGYTSDSLFEEYKKKSAEVNGNEEFTGSATVHKWGKSVLEASFHADGLNTGEFSDKEYFYATDTAIYRISRGSHYLSGDDLDAYQRIYDLIQFTN